MKLKLPDWEILAFLSINAILISGLAVIYYLMVASLVIAAIFLDNHFVMLERFLNMTIFVFIIVISLFHIFAKIFYFFFLQKAIIKRGKKKYLSLLKRIKNNLNLQCLILIIVFVVDLLITAFYSQLGFLNIDNTNNSFSRYLYILALYYIFGGLFFPYLITFLVWKIEDIIVKARTREDAS